MSLPLPADRLLQGPAMIPYLPPAPPETGNVTHDGLAAVLYVVRHYGVHPAEDQLSERQLMAAVHVGPIVTARRADESVKALATTVAVLARIAARLRRVRAWAREAVSAPLPTVPPERPNDGPMARLKPVTPTLPPAPVRRPLVDVSIDF